MQDIRTQADVARNQERTRAAGIALIASGVSEFGDATEPELWLAGELAVAGFPRREATAGWTWQAARRTVTGPVHASLEALFPTLSRTHAPLHYVWIAPVWLTDPAAASRAAACTPSAWRSAVEWLPPRLAAAVGAQPVEECLAALPTAATMAPFVSGGQPDTPASSAAPAPASAAPAPASQRIIAKRAGGLDNISWLLILLVVLVSAVLAASLRMQRVPTVDTRPFAERAASMPAEHFERELAEITASEN